LIIRDGITKHTAMLRKLATDDPQQNAALDSLETAHH